MNKFSRLAGLESTAASPNKPAKKDLPAPTSTRTNAPTHQPPQQDAGKVAFGDMDVRALSRLLLHDTIRSGNYRLGATEKDTFDNVVLALKQQGFRATNGNELLRIAIDACVADYLQRGEESIFHKVLQSRHRSYIE